MGIGIVLLRVVLTEGCCCLKFFVEYNDHSILGFGMAAMPLPCNGILLIQGNLPRIFKMSTLRQASFPIPYFKLF